MMRQNHGICGTIHIFHILIVSIVIFIKKKSFIDIIGKKTILGFKN